MSYNVIKFNSVKNNGLKEINTDQEQIIVKESQDSMMHSSMESYENIARAILENARIKKEQILIKAYEEARQIEDEALEKAKSIKQQAYEEAYSEGQQAGFNMGLQQAEDEKNRIITSAEELLLNAKKQYEEYFENKQKDIFDTILCITETVMKKELSDKSLINNMIYEALESSRNTKTFIIRCNERYIEELNQQVDSWKVKLGFQGNIFIVDDSSVQLGNAIIEKDDGKLEVGIDYALHRVRELMEGKE